MTMKIEINPKIDKLLRSSNIDDVIIGVELIYNEHGRAGIEEYFYKYGSGNPGTKYYCKHKSDGIFIMYDDVDVWIGPSWIDYDRPLEQTGTSDANRIINNKTKQNEH